MSLTDRDKKIVIAIVPILLIVAYWFLLLAPKRQEASTAGEKLAKQEQRRDAARAQAAQASSAKTDFAADYGEIVRLGKAIPSQVDMPSLLVQLDRAAQGTGIRFTKIATGPRTVAAVATPQGAQPGSGQSGATPAAAGGQSAQSAPGQAAESANSAAQAAGERNQAAEQSGVSAADTQTSASAREGGLPVGGGATAPAGEAAGGGPAGLETVPLELEFVGDFFRLADFFHQVKRFVTVVNSDVVVNGRLVTVESVRYVSDPTLFPRIKAELTATIYLSPKAEGTAAGATPAGPSPTPAGGESTPATGGSTPAASATPTATATP